MAKLLITVVLLVAVAWPASAAAQDRIRECGHRDVSGGEPWSYDRPGVNDVEFALVNLTTRRVSCRTARRFADRYHAYGAGRFAGYTCRVTPLTANTYDVRCTASGARVIRWQAIENG